MSLSFFSFATPSNAKTDEASTKRLACFFYDQTKPLETMSLMNPNLPYVWARGLANEHIYIKGAMVDGFFIAESMEGRTRGFFGLRRVSEYDNQYSVADSFCQRALKYSFPDSYQQKVMMYHAGKASFLSTTNVPVVFQKHDNALVKTIDRIVVFGDSLSDRDNLKSWLRVFPPPPYFMGRFSNREIWLDYLQQMTGVAVQNWAYAGAVADPAYRLHLGDKGMQDRLLTRAQLHVSGNVKREIDRFIKQSLHNGTLTNADNTLFTLWIGANDYLPILEAYGDADIFLDQPTAPEMGSNAVVDAVTNHILAHLTTLYNLGARHIYVGNLPDIGKAPRMLKNTAYHRDTNESKETTTFLLSQKVTGVIAHHNQVLEGKIATFIKDHPDVNLIYGDAATVERQIVTSISFETSSFFNYDLKLNAIEFKNANESITINKACYQGGGVRATNNICSEPNRARFWDDLHPTTYAHCLLAAYFHQQAARQGVFVATPKTTYLQRCRPDLIM